MRADADALRLSAQGGRFGRLAVLGGADDSKTAISMAGTALKYGESVVAVLIDSVDRYVEAAAKDREAQKATRRAQNWLTLAMVFLTFVIAVSTALYTVAAWRQAPQSERAIAPLVVSPLPGATADPQSSTRDR
jgi:hypothetical protein